MAVHPTRASVKGHDGVNHEGGGISPTSAALFDGENLRHGVDTQLERAVKYIRTGE